MLEQAPVSAGITQTSPSREAHKHFRKVSKESWAWASARGNLTLLACRYPWSTILAKWILQIRPRKTFRCGREAFISTLTATKATWLFYLQRFLSSDTPTQFQPLLPNCPVVPQQPKGSPALSFVQLICTSAATSAFQAFNKTHSYQARRC